MRTVHCEDAIHWLENHSVLENSSLIASLPDISEFPSFTLNQWKDWFIKTAKLILNKTPEEGVTLFYQSDIKLDGVWIDKSFLIQKAAELLGHELLFHKIACRYNAGTITQGRPAYSHILCFSKKLRLDPAKNSADVLPELGEKSWARGMGMEACLMIAKFLKEQTPTKIVIHPFCGEGSQLAAANFYGLEAIGIERGTKRSEKARLIQISVEKKFISNTWS